MTDIDLRLSPGRRERLESIMTGAASISNSSIGSASHDGAQRPPGTTSVGFVRRRLDMDEDNSDSNRRQSKLQKPSPDIRKLGTITDYFQREMPKTPVRPERTSDKVQCEEPDSHTNKENRVQTPSKKALAKSSSSLTRSASNAESTTSELERIQNELSKAHADLHEYKSRTTGVIIQLLRQLAAAESRERQEQLLRDNAQLGFRVISESAHLVNDTWEDGELFRALQKKHARLRLEREEIDRERKISTNRKRKLPATDLESLAEEEEKDEVLRLRAAILKRDLAKVQAEETDLDFRRKNHIRFSRLIEEEKRSRFGNCPVLNQRYVILQLIGKGGFSEVFKAFDLVEHRYVACKIHQLNPSWSIERRRTYTRHASREYEIHKTLQHSRIVLLFDVFAIDDQCFCTILEYCEGSDLDMYLRQVEVLPERSARCILLQIISGLKYLNSQNPRIVHFDLKPGNILFHKGEIKIADFGLSKLLDGSQEETELTSPGYGSYWYLPPEVFHSEAIVSSKVDVWSAGVIFYQMLFGKRPFGHDLTARTILMEKTILNATEIEFPVVKPPVSSEAKQFIKRCLSHRHQDRPTVFELAEDPYIKRKLGGHEINNGV